MTLAVVAGTGRCGSTLVQELLCRHPATGFVSGLDDKLPKLNLSGKRNGRLYRLGAPRPSGMTSLAHSRKLLEKGRLRVAPSEAYNLLDRQVMAGFSKPCRDLVAGDLTPYVEGGCGRSSTRGSPRRAPGCCCSTSPAGRAPGSWAPRTPTSR